MEKRTIDISTGIVFRTILILLALWFLYLVRDVIALLFIALIITSAIDPIVDWMHRKKIPRSAGVLLVYLVIFTVLGFSISFLIPPIISQFKDFASNFPEYSQRFQGTFKGVNNFFQAQNIRLDFHNFINNFANSLSAVPEKLFTGTIGVFSGLISVLVVFSMAFYMTVKENGVKNFIVSITPERHKEYALSLTDRIKSKMGKWMQGQLLLMLFIFILDYVGLLALGVPYALSLAIFAGIMEIIPYIGPIVSAIPGVLLGFLISPFLGLATLALYIIVQQIENHVIIPQVMKKAVGLNPIIVIVALLIGAKLGGALGAILSVPVATAIAVFVGDFFRKNSE